MDAIDERITTGERTIDVLNDYDLTPSEFIDLHVDVLQRLLVEPLGPPYHQADEDADDDNSDEKVD